MWSSAQAVGARAVADYDARTPKELSVAIGDPLLVPPSVGQREDLVTIQNRISGAKGSVPTRIGIYAYEDTSAIVISSFDAQQEGELSVTEGDHLRLLRPMEGSEVPEGWVLAAHVEGASGKVDHMIRADVGFVPRAYVDEVLAPEDMLRKGTLFRQPTSHLRRGGSLNPNRQKSMNGKAQTILYAASAVVAQHRETLRTSTRWYMVDPRKSSFVVYWDGVTSFALIFVALVTPFEVGFLEGAKKATDPFFLINTLITLIFVVDFVLQFFLITGINTKSGVIWLTQFQQVARHYLRTWFLIDVLSIAGIMVL